MAEWVWKSAINFPNRAAIVFLTEHMDCLTSEFAVSVLEKESGLSALFTRNEEEAKAVNAYMKKLGRPQFWVLRFTQSKEEEEISQKVREMWSVNEDVDTLDDMEAQIAGKEHR